MNLQAPISSIMTNNLITITPEEPMARVKEIIDTHHVHHVPVVLDDAIIGMVSEDDLLYFLRDLDKESNEHYINDLRLKNYKVEEIMTKNLTTLRPEDPIKNALVIFKDNHFNALPVVEGELLVGIITTYDIIVALLDQGE